VEALLTTADLQAIRLQIPAAYWGRSYPRRGGGGGAQAEEGLAGRCTRLTRGTLESLEGRRGLVELAVFLEHRSAQDGPRRKYA
jgi:hypothetical protein